MNFIFNQTGIAYVHCLLWKSLPAKSRCSLSRNWWLECLSNKIAASRAQCNAQEFPTTVEPLNAISAQVIGDIQLCHNVTLAWLRARRPRSRVKSALTTSDVNASRISYFITACQVPLHTVMTMHHQTDRPGRLRRRQYLHDLDLVFPLRQPVRSDAQQFPPGKALAANRSG